jgi:hypothetical protein
MNAHTTKALLTTLRGALGPLLVISVSGHPAFKRALREGRVRTAPCPRIRGAVVVLCSDETRTVDTLTGHWTGCVYPRCDEWRRRNPAP